MRQAWLEKMLRIATPVFENLAHNRLKENLPVDFHPQRKEFAALEAVGRSLTGIAPWLELTEIKDEQEKLAQEKLRQEVLAGLKNMVDPQAKDYLPFDTGAQNLVDAAFLAHGFLRAPHQILEKLDDKTKANLLREFKATRKIIPNCSNWVFFSAMVEGAIYLLAPVEADLLRVISAMRLFEEWYHGDGLYGDGPHFALDYYNSYVIQPMYVDLVHLFAGESREIASLKEKVIARAKRYSETLERFISPEGTFPIVGRSITYRFGNFQLLSQMALENTLPASLNPAQVRCGLNAVLEKTFTAGNLLDESGWLIPGVIGRQVALAEEYISVGSLYLCLAFFLPLGLPETADFWKKPDAPWTNLQIWGGGQGKIDHASH